MQLTNYLKSQGYDLIGGPIRNHKLLQLWVKKTFDEAELYYSNLHHAFSSSVELNEIENQALTIQETTVNDYNFNIGITVLDDILKSLGMGSLDITSLIKGGKKVTISYDNSVTKEIPSGEIANYFHNADFVHPNPDLLRNANRNNILVISGIVFAKNLVVEIDTEHEINANLLAGFAAASDGRIDLSISSDKQIKMISSSSVHFPIAVKANRLQFQKGEFIGLKLITDDRNIF